MNRRGLKLLSFMAAAALAVVMCTVAAVAQPPQGAPSGQSDPGGAGAAPGAPGGAGGMGPGAMNMGSTGFFRYSAGEPFPEQIESQMTAAIYVEDGAYSPEKSNPASISGGKVENHLASDIEINSKEDNFTGVFVNGGDTEYTLSDATIELYGDGTGGQMGGNYGVGAGAVAGNGPLVLKNVKITTNGLGSCAATCSAGGTLKVYDSTLVSKSTGSAGRGSRTTNVTTNGKSYYYNTTIIAESWGALSTDSAEPNVYLEANNCDIRTIQSGYGTYSDNNCTVVVNDSKFTTVGVAGALSGTGKFYFNRTDATTDSNYVMIHAPGPSFTSVGVVEINGGSASTKEAVILVKSANVDMTIDGAKLVSQSGVLIQSVINDDRNTPEVTAPVTGIRATLKKMALEGDILHEDTTRGMSITLLDTTLKGTIKDASVRLGVGGSWTATADSRVTLVGDVDLSAVDAPAGVTITAAPGEGCTLKGSHKLKGGGTLNVTGS